MRGDYIFNGNICLGKVKSVRAGRPYSIGIVFPMEHPPGAAGELCYKKLNHILSYTLYFTTMFE